MKRFRVQVPMADPLYGHVDQRQESTVLEAVQCGFESLHAHHLCRYRLSVRTLDSQSGKRGSIPRSGTIYRVIEYRLVHLAFNHERRVRLPLARPLSAYDAIGRHPSLKTKVVQVRFLLRRPCGIEGNWHTFLFQKQKLLGSTPRFRTNLRSYSLMAKPHPYKVLAVDFCAF